MVSNQKIGENNVFDHVFKNPENLEVGIPFPHSYAIAAEWWSNYMYDINFCNND